MDLLRATSVRLVDIQCKYIIPTFYKHIIFISFFQHHINNNIGLITAARCSSCGSIPLLRWVGKVGTYYIILYIRLDILISYEYLL